MVAAANPSCPKHHRPLPCNTHGRRLQNVNRKCTKAIETECCRPSKRGGGRFTCKLLRSCRTDGQHLWTPLAFFVAGRRFHNFCWVFLCFARARYISTVGFALEHGNGRGCKTSAKNGGRKKRPR